MNRYVIISVCLLFILLYSAYSSYSEVSDVVFVEDESLSVFFCPSEECYEQYVSLFTFANESIYCALFDIDQYSLLNLLLEKQSSGVAVGLLVDNENKKGIANYSFIRFDTSSQLSHNKFCVIDQHIVLTGSTNPTFNGFYKNRNNMIVLHSSSLASVYLSEFIELYYSGEFGSGASLDLYNYTVSSIPVSVYFCPEDNCERHLVKLIDRANESIYFATFSFTSDAVATHLLLAQQRGVSVTGYFDYTQNSVANVYPLLLYHGMNVTRYRVDDGKLHHKVFVVDSSIVWTGSYNPTKNGNKNNDENVLVVYDADVAREFREKMVDFNSSL